MSTNSESYNGWTNRETWAVALHINNDQGWQESVHEALRAASWSDAPEYDGVTDLTSAREVYADSPQTLNYRAGEIIRENVEEMFDPGVFSLTNSHRDTYTISAGIWAAREDIGSLWRVNWDELGAAFLEDIAEQDR